MEVPDGFFFSFTLANVKFFCDILYPVVGIKILCGDLAFKVKEMRSGESIFFVCDNAGFAVAEDDN